MSGLRREHDPARALLRCSRADLEEVALSGRATHASLPMSPALVEVATTVVRPRARFATLRDVGVDDGLVGDRLAVVLPTADRDRVVDVRYDAVGRLARLLHRSLGVLPAAAGGHASHDDTTTTATWVDALAAATEGLHEPRTVQLRWSDGAGVPTGTALALVSDDVRVRRLRPSGDGWQVRDADLVDVWTACCVLADRAMR